MSHFDDLAKEWDQNPLNRERTEKLYNAIIGDTAVAKDSVCLDYGCGTGLLSFYFQPLVEKIYLVDSSKGMLAELESKIKKHGIENMFPQFIPDTRGLKIFKNVNILYCNMSLHHVNDVAGLFNYFHGMLAPGGIIIIADLLKEDGSFHSGQPDFSGHNGFDIKEMETIFLNNGIQTISSEIYHTIKKNEGGREKEYPLFLMTGRKKH